MLEGPVGRGRAQSRRHRAGRRPRRPAARLRPLERPVANQPEVSVAAGRCPGTEFWTSAYRSGGRAADQGPGLDSETNAYRVVHAEGDGLSGLVVDRFDDVLSVQASAWECINGSDRFWHSDRRTAWNRPFSRGVDERVAQQEDFSGRPLASPLLPPRVTVTEHGIRYRIHFEDGHKTGFFCDQRDNRGEMARFCCRQIRARPVLLYRRLRLERVDPRTGGEVTCVDLDEKAVALARENGNANQVRLDVVHADAFGYARQMGVNGKTFGVVVLDPPKLIPDREEIAPGKRKYFDLNVLAMKLVEPGGLLVTCSCSGLLDSTNFWHYWARRRKAERHVQLSRLPARPPIIRSRFPRSKAVTSRSPGCACTSNHKKAAKEGTDSALFAHAKRKEVRRRVRPWLGSNHPPRTQHLHMLLHAGTLGDLTVDDEISPVDRQVS